MVEGGFTDAVRQELARRPLGGQRACRAELAALLRLAGTITMHGGARDDEGATLEIHTSSGAVARRAFTLLQHGYGRRAELAVHAPGGVRPRSTYGVRLHAGARAVGGDLGLLDAAGHPTDALPTDLTRTAAVAYVRGAFLAGGSLSTPGRPPHLEIAVGSERLGQALSALVGGLVEGTVTVTGGRRPRVVLKSGQRIGELLTTIGATGAFLAWDEQRLRRQLRSDATRLANADAANLQRTIEAAAVQVRTVERVVAARGWASIDEELRAVALARLANPAASLTEIGELLDPPLAKSVVHRRLKRLERLAEGDD